MNPHQRAARLCEDAEKVGLDAPTEPMIAEAIGDAQADVRTTAISDLVKAGFHAAARWLNNVEELKDLEDAE